MRNCVCWGLTGLVLVSAGCGGKRSFGVAQTSGIVTCQGQPVPYVTVYFEPLKEGKSAVVGKQGIGLADEKGHFVISTYGDNDGAVVGKHRVRVDRPSREAHPDFKDCECTLHSEIDAAQLEVVGGEENVFEIELKLKEAADNAKKRPPGPDEDN